MARVQYTDIASCSLHTLVCRQISYWPPVHYWTPTDGSVPERSRDTVDGMNDRHTWPPCTGLCSTCVKICVILCEAASTSTVVLASCVTECSPRREHVYAQAYLIGHTHVHHYLSMLCTFTLYNSPPIGCLAKCQNFQPGSAKLLFWGPDSESAILIYS